MRVVFSREPAALHLDLGPLSFQKRPDATNPRRLATGALAGLGTAAAVTAIRRRGREATRSAM